MNTWTSILIILCLVFPPFLLGGVHPLTYAGMGVLTGGLALYLAYRIQQRPSASRGIFLDGWFWLFLLALGVTALQLLPLPLSWLASLSPATDQVLRQTLGVVGLYPHGTWHPLSLAPPETSAKLLRDIASLLLYVSILQWAHKRARLRLLMRISVIIAVNLCGLLLIQAVLRIPYPLFGLYTPTTPTQGWLAASPFLNHKHLSGYLLLHALLTLPLFANANHLRERLGWGAVLGALTCTLLLTHSTYSFLLFLGGLVLFLWLWGRKTFSETTQDPTKLDPIYDPLPILAVDPATAAPLPNKTPEQALEEAKRKKRSNRNYQRSSRDPKPVWRVWKIIWENLGLRLAFGAGILVLGGLLLWGTQSLVSSPHRRTAEPSAWTLAAPLVRHYPLWGTGRGVTPMAWHRFASEHAPFRGQQTITHVESQWLQPLVDWGIPFGLLFVCGCAFLLWRTMRRSQGLLEHSVLIAILALLLQNATDFNLEFIGTGFPFLIFLATLNRLPLSGRVTPKLYSPYLLGGLALAGLVVVVWTTPYAHRHNYHNLSQRWQALSRLPAKDFEQGLKQLVKHHPSDAMLAALATRHYVYARPWQPKKALMWSDIGLFLNPTAADIHLLRGYVLARLKLYEQATQHLSQSVTYQPRLLDQATQTVLRFGFAPTAILSTQQPALAAQLLRSWKRCQEHPLVCIKLAKQAAQKHPQAVSLREQVALLQWQKLRHCIQQSKAATAAQRSVWRDKAKRWRSQLEQTLRQWPQAAPEAQSFSLLLQGHLAQLDGKLKQAQRTYHKIIQNNHGHRWRAFQALLKLHKTHKQYDKAHKLLRQAQHWFKTREQSAQISFLAGRLLQQEGKLDRALIRYGEATQLDSRDKYWLATAKACWKLQRYQCSLRIYQRLIKKPGNQHLKAQLKKLEQDMGRLN